jgi:hypothetical protein
MTLMEIGRGDNEIARLTGVPRSTVAAWRHGRGIARHQREASARPGWRPKSPRAYSYLLGAYLGDGCISVFSPRSASLVITLDSSYPAIIAEIRAATHAVFPGVAVHCFLRMGGSVTAVQANHPALPFAFPQHGPGPKHTREIVLAEWQRELTHACPKQLLRGLIHSDGCRTINRFETKLPSGRIAEYKYPRYSFRTSPPASAPSSASTASCSASGGLSPTPGTSRCRIGRASRCSTSSSARRPKRR